MRFRLKLLLSKRGIAAQEILTLILILGVYLLLLIFVLPQVLGMIFQGFSLFSADVVARDFASLITTSGVATDRIKIHFSPSSTAEYNVLIKDRLIKVQLLKPPEKNDENQERQVSGEASAKIAIDVIGNFEAKNQFTIDKSLQNGKNVYGVDAK